jgi:diguanylate cyclase (GGDEF)-like protein
MSLVLIQFGLSLLAALFGAAAGWWLRGRPTARTIQTPAPSRKEVAAQVLQSLQAAAETVRSCVEQHADCMRTIQSELSASTSTEPAVITKLADSIIASNGLVQHQFNDIRNTLTDKRQEMRDCLANTEGLLFTFASLDRQKHMYGKVLSSLEVLAAELAGDIRGHGQRLQQLTGDLQDSSQQTAAGVANVVTQILDATDEVQRRVSVKEQGIASQAATVHMQAILTHADLLTSLPNRRALEAEMQRAAAHTNGRGALCTLVLLDLDKFSHVNTEYGHQGGDVVLRQVAGMMKKLVRGRDMVARFGGDTFALLLSQTTLHDAMPIAERARKLLEETQFSHGAHALRVTASVGLAQLTPEEMRGAVVMRVDDALAAAQNAGGNACYRHDGQECHPVSVAFHQKQRQTTEESLSLASLWRDSTNTGGGQPGADGCSPPAPEPPLTDERVPHLSGRSLFAANLGRRLSEWKRGGASVSVAVVSVDQLDELMARFGDQAQAFLRQVMGRLLEAATRDMDERCEFEDGLFALILPGTDEANALAVAERLCAQIRQCKVRMDSDLWDLSASIGVAHCTAAVRVMDIMLSAEAALAAAVERGGDAVCVGQPVPEAVTTLQ